MAAWAAVAAPVIGGLLGNVLSSGDRQEARDALRRGMEELDAIGLPPDLSKRIVYEQFQQAGILTPELEQDIDLEASKVSLIEEDPALREAQMDALRGIQERSKIGLSPEDRLALNQIRSEVGRETEAKRQQILQNFAARGQGGSGAELIAALQANQAGAEQASQAGDRIGAMASQNALQALSSAGQLGGSIRQQDFGVAQAKAGAEDAFSLAQFNAANQRQARNVGAMNQAEQYNLGQAQRTADINTQMENQERLRMEEAKRDYWQDRMARANAYSGQADKWAGAKESDANRTAGMWSNIGSAVGTGITAYNQNIIDNQQNLANQRHMKELYEIKYGKKGNK